MQYDIAAKNLFRKKAGEIIDTFFGFTARELTFLDELPTETTNLKNTDFCLNVQEEAGNVAWVIELQTHWRKKKILDLIDYRVRLLTLDDVQEVRPFMLALVKNDQATDVYTDQYMKCKFHLLKFWELEAADYIDRESAILVFIPLMRNGTTYAWEAEKRINTDKSVSDGERADYLTILAIFAGLVDKKLSNDLISRRRDIMKESAFFTLVKEEGREEGREEGEIQANLKTAGNLLKMGLPLEVILKAVEITKAQLREEGLIE